jgi:alkylation response protein AidB-like acyl-CoA dehydrogenase
MRFAFTEDQLALREAVQDLLAKECPAEVVRSAWPEPDDRDGRGAGSRAEAGRLDQLWSALADMGVTGVGVPEDHGGLGMTELDWVLLAEEAGYTAVPQPFVETVCVGAPLLAAAGDPSGDLADVLSGRTLVTTAIGGATSAPWLASATADRPVLLLHGGHRFELRRVTSSDGPSSVDGARRLGSVDVATGSDPDRLVTEDPDLVRLAYDRGVLGTSAQLLGLARRMLDLTVAYVIERRQFGVQIGSFQAIKHHLADAALRLEFASPAVHRAAFSCTTNSPNCARDVSMAKVMAGDAATFTGRVALQCHGAIGYTVENDLHLYLKRAWALSRAWGDSAWHRDRVGRAIGV